MPQRRLRASPPKSSRWKKAWRFIGWRATSITSCAWSSRPGGLRRFLQTLGRDYAAQQGYVTLRFGKHQIRSRLFN